MAQKLQDQELSLLYERLLEPECGLAELRMSRLFRQIAQGEKVVDEDDVYRLDVLSYLWQCCAGMSMQGLR